ncbi:MAG: SusC/RagA family TonB-linked outer membrane protein [Chitinophagaceae bacterium]|nr:SusC/RagA family TonB-linked outer membrane protein [Chitinophagaceae bacterium]
MRRISILLALMLFCVIAYPQSRTINGKVMTADGTPVSFASITEKGTNNGTSADADGNFTLAVKSNVLVITSTGYETQEVTVTGNSVEVVMVPSVQSMSEVIVTGVVGATDPKKMTVSVTKIGADKLNKVPPTSLSSALTGKVAGVKATSFGGQPGQQMDIQLRADNNLPNVSSRPLILVDGVIMSGSLADINADDVESMEVVKGAAASALYGSRAGNGVISVITKRGKGIGLNVPQVTVRNEYGFQNLQHYLDVARHHAYKLAPDWQNFIGRYTKYDGVTYPSDYIGAGFSPGISGNRSDDADHYLDNEYGKVINQQAEFFRTGHNMTNFVSVSNRSEKNNVYLSFENNHQEGVVKMTDGYKRQNLRFNMDQEVFKWLKVSASNLWINRKVQTPGGGGTLFYYIARTEADVDLMQANPDGQPYYLRVNHFNQEATNPLYPLYARKNSEKTNRWLGNYSANIKFTRWADLDISHSMEIQNVRTQNVTPKNFWTQSGGTPATMGMSYTGGSMSQGTSRTNNQNTQVTLNLSHKFGDLMTRAKLSYLYENNEYVSNSISASQFVVDFIESFENFKQINDAYSYKEVERAQNYFAIVGLDYKGKYLLDGMFRYDGSSLFGEDARWNPYYRLSGAYRITEDVKISGIDELKIRAAHGTAGIRPGYNWHYSLYNLSNGNSSPSQKGNPDLKPSKTSETEFGLNMNFLKKFTFEATYAYSTTDDQFLRQPLIGALNDGFTRQWINAGSVKSNTLELTLGANWLSGKDFQWNTNIVYSRIRQRIGDDLPIPPYLYSDGSMGDQDLFYIKAGEIYGVMYGYKFVRTLADMEKQLPPGKSIGDYEINSEGYVIPKGTQGTPQELLIRYKENGADWYGKVGDGNPDFLMGISNTLTYKGLSLYFLLDWKQGGDIYNGKDQRLAFNRTSARMDMYNVPQNQKKAYDYWFLGAYDKNDINQYWVEDGSYLKIREISLSYRLPGSVLDKIFNGFIKGADFKIVGRNLYTFTKYSGYDPEVGSLRMPYDGIYMNPNYRNISLSLGLNF